MMYYSEHRDYPGAKEEFLKNYRPSVGMMFSEGIGAGFRDVSFMLMQSVMEMDKAENQPLLTKEDWEASKFYDPQIKWDDSFTTPKARLLKERRDRERELGFLLERAGAGATASFYAGALVGTVPDPVNYIPFVGIASKAKSAAVLAKLAQKGRLGRAATSAADAAIGTAAYQFFPGYGLMAERETYQVKYDMRDALTDLGLALGVGFGLGAALGRIHPKDPDPTDDLLPLGRLLGAKQEGNTVTVNRQGEVEFREDAPSAPPTASERAWDSVDPVTKKQAVDAELASQSAGVQNRLPVPRQKGAEQAIAQQAARQQGAERIKTPPEDRMLEREQNLLMEQRDVGPDHPLYKSGKDTGRPDNLLEVKQKSLSDEIGTDKSLYYETGLDNAKTLIRNTLRKFQRRDIFVSDNKGFVIGTGGNGIVLEFDSRFVNGRAAAFGQFQEPELKFIKDQGLGIPYVIEKTVPRSLISIRVSTIEELEALRAIKKLAEDFNFITESGPLRAVRKDVLTEEDLEAIIADNPISDEVWNTPRPALKELPPPDDTPIDANEARLQQLEAELDERIRTEEAEGRLK